MFVSKKKYAQLTLLIFFLLFFSLQHILSQTQKRPNAFHSTFIGTFSSVSVIRGDTSLLNDTLTQIANYTYDSVITSRVKFITQVNTIKSLSERELKILTTELTQHIIEYKKNSSLTQIIPSPKLDSIASSYDNRYCSYFINYGNIWSKKQNRKYFAGRTLLISAVVVGFAVLVVLTANSNGSSDIIDDLTDNKDSSGDPFFGMNCYYVVYDKQEKQLCYVRGLRFNSDKTDNNPFNPLRVEKQIESLFYLPH